MYDVKCLSCLINRTESKTKNRLTKASITVVSLNGTLFDDWVCDHLVMILTIKSLLLFVGLQLKHIWHPLQRQFEVSLMTENDLG